MGNVYSIGDTQTQAELLRPHFIVTRIVEGVGVYSLDESAYNNALRAAAKRIRKHYGLGNRYQRPHQGKQECQRRLRRGW